MAVAVIHFYRIRLVWMVVRLFASRFSGRLALRSPARPDRSGAQIHDDLMAGSFCFRRGLRWAGSVGKAHLEDHQRLNKLLGLSAPRQRGGWSLLPSYYREQIPGSGQLGPPSSAGVLRLLDRLLGLRLLSPEFPLDAKGIFSAPFISHLRSSCPVVGSHYTGCSVVMHIRRGDISAGTHPQRHTSNGVYLWLLDELERLLGSGLHVTIHSQAKSDEPFNCFLARGAEVKLDVCIEEAWRDMINADILVMSKSSFAYVPAIYNPNIVLYQPFWHGCLPEWMDLGSPAWSKPFLARHTKLLNLSG